MNENLSLMDLLDLFPDNTSARQWLEQQCWNTTDGIPDYCAVCGIIDTMYVLASRPGFFKCPHCTQVFTVRTGTVMERSHIDLRKWVIALWLFVTNRHGISSIHLAEVLGIRQASAWFMLQRLRTASATDMFVGSAVEADETYIGGLEKNKHSRKKKREGRGIAGKIPVVGLYSRATGQVFAEVMPDTSAENIQGFLRQHLTDQATLYTDEHRSYSGYPRHYSVNHSAKEFVSEEHKGLHTNSIESVWAVLKRSLIGTYISVSAKHLQAYVNEICFKLSNKYQSIMEQMKQLAHQMIGVRVTYSDLIS